MSDLMDTRMSKSIVAYLAKKHEGQDVKVEIESPYGTTGYGYWLWNGKSNSHEHYSVNAIVDCLTFGPTPDDHVKGLAAARDFTKGIPMITIQSKNLTYFAQ